MLTRSNMNTTKSINYMNLFNQSFPLLFLLALGLLLLIYPDISHASKSGQMAWETPLEKVRDSISGPVAFTISLLGIIGGGTALVFGGEINDFIRKIIMLVLAISVIVAGNDILSTLFSARGALL